MSRLLVMAILGAFLGVSSLCLADSQESYTIIIKNHKFEPAQLEVPAGKKIELVVDNQDSTIEEFESYKLNREKIVAAKTKISIFVGPLKKGSYKYFGEFHKKTAQGMIVAK